MKHYTIPLVLTAAFLVVLPAPAGILFGKRAKPVDSIPLVIGTLKTDPDEHKRAAAATQLRQCDPAANPEIIPALIEALQRDPKAGVRVEAAQSLSRLRPVSPDAGAALEQAMNDPSVRVRMEARKDLLYYRLAGYHGNPKQDEPTLGSPALGAAMNGPPAAPLGKPALSKIKPVPQPGSTFSPAETPPPPLATPVLVPTDPPQLQTPPVKSGEDGPPLTPPGGKSPQ
jgi:hypothetical protein